MKVSFIEKIRNIQRFAPLIIPLMLIGFNLSFFVPQGDAPTTFKEEPLATQKKTDSTINNEKVKEIFAPDAASLEDYAWNIITPPDSREKDQGYSFLIMAKGSFSIDRMAAFLKQYNPCISLNDAVTFARMYKELGRYEGVNHDLAFAQMCLETGFLKFGGVVKPEQNNFCGLGALTNCVSGDYFPDRRTGVTAHIQHLKAYGCAEELKTPLVDQRFDVITRGSAKEVNQLTGRWATDRLYHKKIKSLLNRMHSMEFAIEFPSKKDYLILNYD